MKETTRSGETGIYTVSRLLGEIRRAVVREFNAAIRVEGEISNFVLAASGHMYFTVKDHAAQIRCAMFRGKNRALKMIPENGAQVILRARPDCYEPRGDLQLIVEQMEPAGVGELQRQFEILKRKLHREGLFDEARKRPLPAWPRTVGIVTSAQGAALRDVIAVMEKRCAAIDLVVYSTPVQGPEASAEICRALELANRHRKAEVLLLVRGGGSIEDLWAFNTEAVARKIAASELPVVSGVGHEIDFTIADFVSDCRAPTPSAAAERVSPDGQAVLAGLLETLRRLHYLVEDTLGDNLEYLRRLKTDLLRSHPENRIRNLTRQFDELQRKLAAAAENRLAAERRRAMHTEALLARGNLPALVKMHRARLRHDIRELAAACGGVLSGKIREVEKLASKLDTLSPYATLKRGYAIVTDEKGGVIRSAKSVRKDQSLDILVEDGGIAAKVI